MIGKMKGEKAMKKYSKMIVTAETTQTKGEEAMKNNCTINAGIANNQTKGEENMRNREKRWIAGMARTALVALVMLLAMFAGGEARYVFASDGAGGLPSRYPAGASQKEMLAYLVEKYPGTRNQHLREGDGFGTCWAHAAVALAEFYMISHNLSDANGPVDRTVDYSELQLHNFCYRQGPDPYQGSTGDSIYIERKSDKDPEFKNLGGNFKFAGQSLMRGNGLVADEGAAAYVNMDYVNENPMQLKYARSNAMAILKNYYVLDIRKNPQSVKQKIMENGAVGIRYFSFNPEDEDTINFINLKTSAAYNYKKKYINHAVVIVGWDDNYPAENFKKQPPKNGAWLVRNSHSNETKISADSYFWLSYCDVGIEKEASYVFEMADRSKGEVYDHLYCYDAQLHGTEPAKTAFAANVFRAVQENEVLQAIQLDATEKAAGNVTIWIYRNLANLANPQSGALVAAAVTTGYFPYKGSYTVKLQKPVTLHKGETFAIVVQSENPLDRECDFVKKSVLYMDTTLHSGESFCFVDGYWLDLANETDNGKLGNLCIRALTNGGEAVKGGYEEEAEEVAEEKLADGNDAARKGVTANVSSGKAAYQKTVQKRIVYIMYRNGRYRYEVKKARVRKLLARGWECRKKVQWAVADIGAQVYWILEKGTRGIRYTSVRQEAIWAKSDGNKAGKAFLGSYLLEKPVYEVSRGGVYRYTASRKVVRKLQNKGWTYEGIAWYAP